MEQLNQKENYYTDLIIRFLKGNASFSEEKELTEWIQASPANKEEFIASRNIWVNSSMGVIAHKTTTNKRWRDLHHKLGGKHRMMIRYSPAFLLKIASVVVVVFITGMLAARYMMDNRPEDRSIACEIVTPLGSRTNLTLPDGTNVWLNAGSKLTYDNTFNHNLRNVYLQGEAFFNVQPNKHKPFIVTAGKINIRALGTSFNVKAYSDENTVSATLVEGIIQVNGVNDHQFSYTLKPQQNITIVKSPTHQFISATIGQNNDVVKAPASPNKISPVKPIELSSRIKTILYTSWKDSHWTIEGEPLGNLAVLLERRYNVKIHLDSPELNSYKFTGTIKNETFEQVLQFLRYTTPLKYKIGKGEVWWEIDPQLEKQYSKILEKTVRNQ